MKQHDHSAFVKSIKARQMKLERRREIGRAMLKGVGKVFGRSRDSPEKSKSAPSVTQSSYVKSKQAKATPQIGQLTPNYTPP